MTEFYEYFQTNGDYSSARTWKRIVWKNCAAKDADNFAPEVREHYLHEITIWNRLS